VSGVDLTAGLYIYEGGSFSADGGGKITAGVDDFALGTAVSSGALTGTYSVANDGTGTISLTSSSGRSFSFAITMTSTSKAYLVISGTTDFDTGAGLAEQQTSSAFATAPSGTFVFLEHKLNSSTLAEVGTLAISGGVVNGSGDLNNGGTLSSVIFTGSLNPPDANGRGTGTYNDNLGPNGNTSTFAYYVVDSSNVRFFFTDAGVPGLARAELQAAGPFATASLSGSYAFGSRGDDSSANGGINGINTVGAFTASGGNINAGSFDSVADAISSTDILFNTGGTYSVSSNGRAVVNLVPATGGTIQQYFWMVSPSRAFFITNDSNKVERGTVDLQSGSFSNATLNGQYAFVMDGFDLNLTNPFIDRVGWIQWNGAGTLTWNEFVNNSGSTNTSGALAGTYAVGNNGRATASVTGLSYNANDIVIYLTSGTGGYMLENDAGVEINGQMSQQP
jgi:hypothetical protein